MALSTVQNYIDEARSMLSDTDEPYRYSDAVLIRALNLAFMEARRLRGDLFLYTLDDVPQFSAPGETVTLDQQYQTTIIFFICGFTELGDVEDTEDSRASGLIDLFRQALTGG